MVALRGTCRTMRGWIPLEIRTTYNCPGYGGYMSCVRKTDWDAHSRGVFNIANKARKRFRNIRVISTEVIVREMTICGRVDCYFDSCLWPASKCDYSRAITLVPRRLSIFEMHMPLGLNGQHLSSLIHLGIHHELWGDIKSLVGGSSLPDLECVTFFVYDSFCYETQKKVEVRMGSLCHQVLQLAPQVHTVQFLFCVSQDSYLIASNPIKPGMLYHEEFLHARVAPLTTFMKCYPRTGMYGAFKLLTLSKFPLHQTINEFV